VKILTIPIYAFASEISIFAKRRLSAVPATGGLKRAIQNG